MNMLKRSLALMLTVCMLLSAVPFGVLAEETATEPVVDATEAVETVGDQMAAEETETEAATEEATEAETEAATEAETEAATEAETEPAEVETEPEVAETEPVVIETEPEVVVTDEAAGDAVVTADVSADTFIRVFHLDCGRKYFTVDQVKGLIDAISAAHYTHMELAIGNDGLRLLLDDMDLEVNGTTYSGETIKSGIQSGNLDYSHSGEWTETEMDTIIAYADSKNIEIIPLVNNPGHMDSILAAMKACGIEGYYKSSARTVDLENAAAVAFTQALVMKYAEYFDGKGCKYFNIGADEYANDCHTADSTGMGFGYLIDNNMYGNFITYVNTLVADICDLGMTPIAFNDGIYFRENTSFGTFDTRLVVASWTGGWGGIKPASTTFLQSKGHQILNTNERWYYVLGRRQAVNSTYCYESALSNAQSESVTTVTDHKTGVTSMGAMQCVWCDDPSVDYETYKSNVMTLINTLSSNNSDLFVEPVKKPEMVTVPDDTTGISVTGPDLTGVTITEIKDETVIPTIDGVSKILAYDVKAFVGEKSYTGEIEISVPVPADWARVRGGVLASESGEEVLDIEGKLENGVFTFTVPHLSGIVTYASDYDQLIELEVGGTSDTITDNSGYYTTAEGLNTAVATVTLGGNAGSAATVEYTATSVTCRNLLNSNSSYQATNYYVLADDGKYYPLYVSRTSRSSWGRTYYSYTYYYSTDGGETYTQCGAQENLTSTYTNANIDVYTKSGTDPVPAKTTVAFTGVSVGETTATIGSTTYKIVVSKKQESATITVGESKNYPDSSDSAPVVDNTDAVDAVIENGTLTITAKAIGTAIVTTDKAVYTITVVEFDPSTVTPLTVEYWITNIVTRTVESTSADPVTTQQISAATAGVATAEGADINALMPAWTIKRDGDSGADREVEFWHVRLLDKTQSNNSTSRTEEQTTDAADDETTNGDAVTRVRYYDPGDGNGRRWQMLAGATWLDVDLNDNQIVAYYMEVIDIQNANGSTELHVNAADWGKLGDGSPASSYADTSKYCSISLQIVYEDGSGNPATTTAADLDSKTIIYNYWDEGRGIGTFVFDTLGQFEIYQISAETGSADVTFSGGAWGTAQVNKFSWDNNEKVVWSGESETASIYNNTKYPTDEDPKDNLMWDENKEAILIRVYVRAVETDDSLTVVYYDEKFGDTMYTYNITVPEAHDFKNNLVGTPSAVEGDRINVTGCGIENIYGVTQYFQTDLTKVPEAVGKYRNDLYKYTGSKISEDGKTLYLYYNIDTTVLSPNFVVDFGLSITFDLEDLLGEGTEVDDVTAVSGLSSRYGTLTYNDIAKTFTYKPNKVLQNIDVLTIALTINGKTNTTNVGVTPATTVYYEESFLTLGSGWSTVGSDKHTSQTTLVLDKVGTNNYGYDPVYANDIGSSNGTYVTTSQQGAEATFTFTGSGFELYANCDGTTGWVTVIGDGNTKKVYLVDTQLTPGDSSVTEGQTDGPFYNIPVVSEKNLVHGTYTVKIRKTKDDGKPIVVDGFRVINTISEEYHGDKVFDENAVKGLFVSDKEDHPEFHQIRDLTLYHVGLKYATSDNGYLAYTVTEKVTENGTEKEVDKKYIYLFDDNNQVVKIVDEGKTEQDARLPKITEVTKNGVVSFLDEKGNTVTSDMGTPMKVSDLAKQVYAKADGAEAIITSSNVSFVDKTTMSDLLINGPKNEVYLYEGYTLTFKVSTDRCMQLGLKAPKVATGYSVTVQVEGADEGVYVLEKTDTMNTSVDMFYNLVTGAANEPTTYVVTVSNTGSGILAVTDLKICDDPDAVFVPLTGSDIEGAVSGKDTTKDPEPEIPSVPMFRMYDPNSGEHFYTGSDLEKKFLEEAGWHYEGVGFNFPAIGDPVHRLYDPKTGEHLYTMDAEEMERLLNRGWNYENVAFNSAGEDGVPQYRLHNPNETRGAFHFTGSEEERDHLISLGWIYEGIGWFSCLK